MPKKAFKNFRHNGIHLTFPNGNSISTIWGVGSYTENSNTGDYEKFKEAYFMFLESNDVEIMILNCPNKLMKKIINKYNIEDDENPIGHINITQWLEILNLLAKGKQ